MVADGAGRGMALWNVHHCCCWWCRGGTLVTVNGQDLDVSLLPQLHVQTVRRTTADNDENAYYQQVSISVYFFPHTVFQSANSSIRLCQIFVKFWKRSTLGHKR